MLTLKRYRLSRARILAFLDVLDTLQEPAVTLHLPAGIAPEELDAYVRQAALTADMAGEVVKEVASVRTGAVLFWGESYKRLIAPPFPQREKYVTGGYDTAPLRGLLAHDYRIGIVLVRLGSFSIGLCEGEKLVDHKTGTGLVHGRQRQGGSSSSRFRRRREEQVYHFLERVAEHAQEKLSPYARTLDFVVYGGARTTIRELLRHSDFLRRFDDRLLPPLLDIPEPRHEVLERAVAGIWSSRVVEWREGASEFT